MLRDVRPLANVAVVEIAQHRLALDVHAGISELEVSFLLQTADCSFSPISAAIVRIAGGIEGLFEGLRGGIGRSGSDVNEVAAGLSVLNVVPDNGNRNPRVSGIDVEASK